MARPPSVPDSPQRRRAALILAGVAVLLVLLLIGVVVSIGGLFAATNTSDTADTSPATGPSPPGDTAPAKGPASGAAAEGAAAEQALATRPMLAVPGAAVAPHALSPNTAGPALTLPTPAVVTGRLVPGGFPATSEGAVAQLVALTSTGLAGGDPVAYDAAYSSVAESGAPPAAVTWMHQALVSVRRHAGIRATGVVSGLTITWTPTSALVKGTSGDGSYAVVCVLGELAADYQGRVVTGGVGDCQAMRRVGADWRVAAGAQAAMAPSAWPGSAEAVAAGYRELR